MFVMLDHVRAREEILPSLRSDTFSYMYLSAK